MTGTLYDIAIIGGGVNGCGIARDAAGRGLSVFLAEQNDLASGTSSASTKLIHGGLRYLEHYEFRLVRESLIEREILWGMAPHIIWPLRFVLPHHKGLRPAWLIRLGLFLYDHLGGRKRLPASRSVNLRLHPAGEPLKGEFTRAFEYSDCWVEDARLVVLNARDAARRGAEIRVRTEVVRATRTADHWQLEIADRQTGGREQIKARVLVNAAGPWISKVIAERIGGNSTSRTRLVKGSHIVVPRLFDQPCAYIFQNSDQRIVFAIPYERDFTLIGTTDVDFEGDPADVSASKDEIAYLCEAASGYFEKTIGPADVVWTYSGVRPLYDDGASAAQEATRDYVLELTGEAGRPALLNVFGGKITTHRRLAEDALGKLDAWFPEAGGPWTRGATLPGGDFDIDGFDRLADAVAGDYPAIDAALIRRLVRAYGTEARRILSGVTDPVDLGLDFGGGLTQREVEYLIRAEWAVTAQDVLWRRTKLGLRLSADEARRLDQWMTDNYSVVTGSAA